MRKIIAGVLIFIIFIGFSSSYVMAFGIISDGDTAVVEEVIDINAIRVRLPNGSNAFVRLIGVEPNGSPSSIEFLRSLIMGNSVTLFREPTISNSGRWNYAYVFRFQTLINAEIIRSGQGRANAAHSTALLFSTITEGQNIARSFGVGLWASELRPGISIFGDRININTVPTHILVNELGLTAAQASAIDGFRSNSVFRNVNDVKFALMQVAHTPVAALETRNWFSQNRSRLSIFTNINLASQAELMSLSNAINPDMALNIINSRNNQTFDDINQLLIRGLVNNTLFNNISPFIGLMNMENITFARPNNRANINLATHNQLVQAGASHAQAEVIINQRQHTPLRNLQDLRGNSNFAQMSQITALMDNLTGFTNINTAVQSEIETLFGNHVNNVNIQAIMAGQPSFTSIHQIAEYMDASIFNQISPFIYVTTLNVPNITNINTATHAQLTTNLNLTPEQATQIINLRPITLPSQIPSFITTSNIRNQVSLYTNINTASNHELLTLHPQMTSNMTSTIMLYRQEQPFASLTEIAWLFGHIDAGVWFGQVSEFLIVR